MIGNILAAVAILFVGFSIAFSIYYFISSIALSYSFMSEKKKKETLHKLFTGDWQESDDE